MTPEERTEWVLWSVRNDPDIELPTGQEKIAAHYIREAIVKAREEALEEVHTEAIAARDRVARSELTGGAKIASVAALTAFSLKVRALIKQEPRPKVA